MTATDSMPVATVRRGRLSRTAAFVVVALAFVAVFLGSGTPVPLYNTYRADDGITSAGLAITTVVYLGTTAVALLTTGRLSNHVGRRPVAIVAALFAAAGCLVMLDVHGLPELMAGRVLQGIACGIASSALGSYVLDLTPERPGWLGPVITSNAPPFAIPLGALISGVLVQYGPAPRFLVYSIVAGVLVVLAILLALCPDPVERRPGALASLIPRVHVPRGQGRLLFAVGAGLVGTWALSGFYQAFSPVLAADELGTSNAFIVALVFASIVVLSPVGGLLTGRLRAVTGMRLGLVVFVVATAAILLTLHLGQIWWFLAASAFAGIAQGSANAGGMRSILGEAAPADRAGLLATLYLISYAGAAGPGLVAGQFATFMATDQIAVGYGALVVVAVVVALVTLAARQTNRSTTR
ncbi:MFS transporter [Curtobacterium flaccumfaciens]|uniref:MFS transporter n=1 Tax=Curtobacterium flaccumfaciens TaxID=2035 RepID=UPI0038792E83